MTEDATRRREPESYWSQSRLPLTSLVFVAPLLALYEGGLFLLGPNPLRNAADVWLRQLLAVLGFGQYFLLPALCVAVLVGWHFTTRRSWRVSPGVLAGMAVESAVLAFVLWQVARIGGGLWERVAGALAEAGAGAEDGPHLFRDLVAFLGAGIYEELLFRLILLTAVAGLLMWLKVGYGTSVAVAVVTTSLLFAAAHHLPGSGPFELPVFIFRFLAGVFFSVVFALRGFGIVVGAHAGYDVLVGIVVPLLF